MKNKKIIYSQSTPQNVNRKQNQLESKIKVIVKREIFRNLTREAIAYRCLKFGISWNLRHVSTQKSMMILSGDDIKDFWAHFGT